MTKPVTNYSVDTNQLKFISIPQPVGYWILGKGGLSPRLAIYEKPTTEQIKNTEAMFGWVFVDVQP